MVQSVVIGEQRPEASNSQAEASSELAKAQGVFSVRDVFACLGFASVIQVHSEFNLCTEKL